MKMTKKEYQNYVNKKSPPSPILKNMILAFLIGGSICTVGQAMLNWYKYCGLSEQDAGTAVSITLIFVGALLTGLHLYDKLAKYAGAGTLVPITGFANSIVSPALEFKSEGFVLGMSAKMFTIAGPVLVFGIATSIIYGLILCLLQA